MSANSSHLSLCPEQSSPGLKTNECSQTGENGSSSNVSSSQQSRSAQPETPAFEYPPNYQTILSKNKKPAGVTTLQKSSASGDPLASTINTETQPLVEREPHLYIPSNSRWQGLLICVGAWFALLAPSGILNTFGTFQAYLGRNQLQGEPEGKIGWIFSLYAYLFMLGTVLAGPLFDAYGLRLLLIPGCIGFVVSMMTFSICSEFPHFILAFGVLGGISGSLVWTTSLALVGHWFYDNRAITTGVVTTSGPVGGVLFPLLFEALVPRLGFVWTIRIIGFISTGCFMIAIALMRPRLTPTYQVKWQSNFQHYKDPRFVLTVMAMFVIELAVLIPPAFITVYALAKGIDVRTSYQLLAIMNFASIAGRALPGFLADACGRFNTMILTSLPCSLSILTLWLNANSTSALIQFAALFGLLSGTAHSLTAVCISQLCTTEEYASVYGTAYYVVSLSYLMGIPVAGMVLDEQQRNFDGLILYCGFMYLASTILFVAARVAGVGWRPSAKY